VFLLCPRVVRGRHIHHSGWEKDQGKFGQGL